MDKKDLEEKWNSVDKKVVIALVIGGIIGAIAIKASVNVELKMASSQGYAKGAEDVIKTLLEANKV